MSYILTPAESSTRFLKYDKHLKSHPGIKFGTPRLNKYVIPAKPGEVIAFVGRPGHGKSSIMSFYARQEAQKIINSGKAALNLSQTGEAVLYATYEQTIESQEASIQVGLADFSISDIHWGRVDTTKLITANKARIELPIWLAGQSFFDPGQPPMFIDELYTDILSICKGFNIKFNLICLDYLQRIPTRKGTERHLQVSEAILGAKDLAMSVGCPVFLGVQAKQEVDKRADQTPGMSDTYYTAELDHVIDKGFGLLKPIKCHDLNSQINFTWAKTTVRLPVTDNLFFLSMFKQRGEQGSRRFPLRFDMNSLQINDMDLTA